MTAIIDSLSTGKKVMDNYLLDQRPLNLDEMHALNDCMTRTINDVQALFRMIPTDSKMRVHPAITDLARLCGMRYVTQYQP